jgi:CRISPR-associated protein Cmr5
MQTLDQQRAAFVWQQLEDFFGESTCDDKQRTAFCNLAKSAPALIMGNGLMQTLAFFEKKSNESRALNRQIFAWLARRFAALGDDADFAAVMRVLHGSDSETYLQATEETLELLRWVRQLAQAMTPEA